jgi:hypothetical protein
MVSPRSTEHTAQLTVTAAMPSLHFGYSLLIGLTVTDLPLSPHHRRSRSVHISLFNQSHPELAQHLRLPSSRRLTCILVGFIYPFPILLAIVSPASNFILGAVAGAMVCLIGWRSNAILLNLLPLEDHFLWCLRMQKPVQLPLPVFESSGKELAWELEGHGSHGTMKGEN